MPEEPAQVKILFRLKRRGGYPPVATESLWGTPIGGQAYQIDSIPFFVRGLSWGDVVTVTRKGPELHFKEVIDTDGHSTLRVVSFDEDQVDPLRDHLRALGCSSEYFRDSKLLAIDVPPAVDWDEVVAHLAQGEAQQLWEYEEAAIRHDAEPSG